MDGALFLRGLVIGFSLAAPVSPIGVLCIRRSLADGPRAGFISGLGAATADATYGCIAGFGPRTYTDYGAAGALVLGVFAGSSSWWLILCTGVGLLRARLTPGLLASVNRIAGSMLLAFGIYAVLRPWA